MKSRDLGLVVLGALLGAGVALLLRSSSGTSSPSADGEDVASLRQRVSDLERTLAQKSPPSLLAPAPSARAAAPRDETAAAKKPAMADEATAGAESAATKRLSLPARFLQSFARNGDGTYTPTGATGTPVPAGGADREARDVLYPVEVIAEEPAPAAADIPRLLDSSERKDRIRAIREIARSRLREFLPTLTDHVNRPDRREDAVPLIDAIAELKDRRWSALQATGAPDTPIDGDLGTAWASKSPEMGLVTLDLEYDRAVRVDGVRVHETLAPGAIARIEAKAANGAWETIWEGEARRETSPTWFEPPVRATLVATNAIRLVVDSDRVPGWNEIDAVELIGDGLRQWAARATASSSYSD